MALDREHADITAALEAAFARVLGTSSFILGEEVERFEDEWARECGTAHCVGVASGTAALSILLRAAGIGAGDEVIVPAHTFIASALAVVQAGAIPVLCDVDEHTGLIDVEAAEAVAGPRTAAVLAVHLYGQLCNMTSLSRFADRRGIALVEDAAHAHGAEYHGRRAGGFGAGAGFSFYPSKNLGALGDGGAICTNDAGLASRARELRNLGQRQKGQHVVPAGNDRLDGLQAAFLRVKLPGLSAANDARQAHSASYRNALSGRVGLLHEHPGTPCIYHVFPVRVPNRDAVAERVRSLGTEVGVHYTPALQHQPALQGIAVTRGDLPRADAWAAEELSLPMFPTLRPDEIRRAADACLQAVDEALEFTRTDGGRHD